MSLLFSLHQNSCSTNTKKFFVTSFDYEGKLKQKLRGELSNINQEWHLTLKFILGVDRQYIECYVRQSVEDNPTKKKKKKKKKSWYNYTVLHLVMTVDIIHSLKWKEVRCQDDIDVCMQLDCDSRWKYVHTNFLLNVFYIKDEEWQVTWLTGNLVLNGWQLWKCEQS